jgi:putative DNA methylase
MTYHKKLIEVALPLKAMNDASVREKSIRHGHPSTLHLWWSRKPLATCRAVLFASLVDDPSAHPEEFPTEQDQDRERLRLFQLLEQLITWENSNNQEILAKARIEILKSTNGNPPPVLDPFCGGGSIPLEAQRLGLEAHGKDLNPVAVLISKALIEIPPKFAGCAPANLEAQQSLMGRDWHGAQGLADDIRYYGKWMRDEAERRIGRLYPKVTLPKEYGGSEATVIAWLWVRTVICPNPACSVQMPLASKWWLSTKKGKVTWMEPQVDHAMTPPIIHFTLKTGKGQPQPSTVSRQGATCIVCKTSVPFDHIRIEGKAGRMDAQLIAIVAEGQHGRLYLSPDNEQAKIAYSAKPKWKPEELVTTPSHDVDRLPMYGMFTWGDAFTPRQLSALTTFSDLVEDAREKVLADAKVAGMSQDNTPLNDGGIGATAYADAVATYLGLIVSRSANTLCSLAIWSQSRDQSVNVFSRQALAMNWDFPEVNPFAGAAGDFAETSESMSKSIARLPATISATAVQSDATMLEVAQIEKFIVSTDPPYYDNIGYAVM